MKAELAAGRRHSEEDEKISQQPNGRLRSSTLDSSRTPIPSPVSLVQDTSSIRVQSRPRVIRSKISDLETKIAISQTQLDSDLRLIRNLAVLTPFQRSTRSRLQAAVIGMASKIMQVRLEMVKMVCHRDILAADLAAQERDWQHSKNQALKAATEALETQSRPPIPQMKVSAHDDDAEMSERRYSHPLEGGDEVLHKSESSICESFHSALDFGPDWPSHARSMSSFVRRHDEDDTPGQTPYTESSQVSRKSFPFEASSMDTPHQNSSDNKESEDGRASNAGSEIGHERFYTAPDIPDEEAEDWDKTRAAKRVSLVRLPSDLKVAGYLGRHRHRAEGRPSETSES